MTQLPSLSFSDCVGDLAEVIRSFSSPPVVLAMDLGALMALKVGEKSRLSALILVSPAPPQNVKDSRSRPQRLLWLKYRLLIFLHRPLRIDDKDFRAYFLAPLTEDLQNALTRQTVPESTALVREFLLPRVNLESGPPSCPTLVLGGHDDRITPAATSKRLAAWLGADFKEYPGQGHWLIERDGELIVRDIHRWIIQKLGETILLADFS